MALLSELRVSTPAPTVHLEQAELTLRGWEEDAEGDLAIQGQLHLRGMVRSRVCDVMPGEHGVIREVQVYHSDEDLPTATLPLNVIKRETAGSANSEASPFAFEGRFDAVIPIDTLFFGTNGFLVEASDSVFGTLGVCSFYIDIVETDDAEDEASDENLEDEDALDEEDDQSHSLDLQALPAEIRIEPEEDTHAILLSLPANSKDFLASTDGPFLNGESHARDFTYDVESPISVILTRRESKGAASLADIEEGLALPAQNLTDEAQFVQGFLYGFFWNGLTLTSTEGFLGVIVPRLERVRHF